VVVAFGGATAAAVRGTVLRGAAVDCFCGADVAGLAAGCCTALSATAAATLLDEAASLRWMGAARAFATCCLRSAMVVACSRSCFSSLAMWRSLSSSFRVAKASFANSLHLFLEQNSKLGPRRFEAVVARHSGLAHRQPAGTPSSAATSQGSHTASIILINFGEGFWTRTGPGARPVHALEIEMHWFCTW
jgi:hypothetical protein